MKRLKWVLPLFIISMFGAGAIYFYAASTNAESERTIQIGVLENSMNVGLLQYSLNENGELEEPIELINKEILEGNLLINIFENQKEETDIEFGSVYLDAEGNTTENENEIRGIVFLLKFLNDKEVLNVYEHFNVEPFINSLKGSNTELEYAFYDDQGIVTEDKNKAKELRAKLELSTVY